MENKHELSVFGRLIILAIFAGIFYWFSLPVNSETTPINILNILAKCLILIVLLIIVLCAMGNQTYRPFVKSNIALLILALDSLIANWNNIPTALSTKSESVSPTFYIAILIAFGAVSAIFILISIGVYIAELLDPKTGKLQALKDLFAQNPFTKLMFKQPKKEEPVEKVKM